MDQTKVFIDRRTRNDVELKVGVVSKPVTHSRRKFYQYDRYTNQGSPEPVSYTTGTAYQQGTYYLENRLPYGAAYDSFWNKAQGGKNAMLALTLYEWKTSLGMITQAATSIRSSVRKLRQGDLYGSVRELGIRDRRVHRRLRKEQDRGFRMSDLWLELNFGWAPLIGDIYQAAEVLSQTIPTTPVKGRKRIPVDYYKRESTPWGDTLVESAIGRAQVQICGDVVGVNPNLNLARQLGLTNPAAVLWDAVPFSFVVDWFLPVSKMLGRLDVGLGIDVGNLAVTRMVQCTGQYRFNIDSRVPPEVVVSSSSFIQLRREPVGRLPLPGVSIPPLTGDLWRAATSVALAVQQLTSLQNGLFHNRWR